MLAANHRFLFARMQWMFSASPPKKLEKPKPLGIENK
jgi:hypothetical protein